MTDLTLGIRSAHHLIRLNSEAKADPRLCLSFLSKCNGKSFFLLHEWFNSHKLNLFTHASGVLGFGAIFGTHWCYGRWPNEWAYTNIATLEFFPIVLSLFLWGHEMKNRCILFSTDNEAIVDVITKQSFRDKILLSFVHQLVFICLHNNIVF